MGTTKRIDCYTKKETEYRYLTIEEIKNLSGHALIISNKGDVIRVKINGAVKTWKKDIKRYTVPVKYGLHEYGSIDEGNYTNLFVKEV